MVSVMTTKAKQVFTSVGFSNWKKATERFKEHVRSQAQEDAMAAYISEECITINSKSSQQCPTCRRQSLMKQLYALQYLLWQAGVCPLGMIMLVANCFAPAGT